VSGPCTVCGREAESLFYPSLRCMECVTLNLSTVDLDSPVRAHRSEPDDLHVLRVERDRLMARPIAGWGEPDPLADLGLATHSEGNCLRNCVAMLLAAHDKHDVPDPTPFFASHGDGWRERYNAELARKLGLRLEQEPYVTCRERTSWRPWIAVIAEPEHDANHALLARGPHVLHDPSDRYQVLPRDGRVLFGLVLVPANTRRRGRWGEPLD